MTDPPVRSVGWHAHDDAATVLQRMAEQDKQTGERLQALRERRGWSRETLAYKATVSTKTIERIEKGQVEGRITTIRALADALDVDEYQIIGEPSTPAGVPIGEQVDTGFEEFREHVHNLEARLERIEKAVVARGVRLDELEQTMRELTDTILAEIRGQLEQQSRLLADIRTLVGDEDAFDVFRRALGDEGGASAAAG